MVRYPHTAKVIGDSGSMVDGEWIAGEPAELFVNGRYEESGTSGKSIIRFNAAGNEVIVRGEFYTKEKPIPGVSKIEISELGVSKPIICWTPYQTHSVISV